MSTYRGKPEIDWQYAVQDKSRECVLPVQSLIKSHTPTYGQYIPISQIGITVIFSEAMDVTTLIPANITLRDKNYVINSVPEFITVAITYDAVMKTATITPTGGYAFYITAYEVQLSAFIKSAANVNLSSHYDWWFQGVTG